MIVALIDYKKLTEEQKKEAFALYGLEDENVTDFTVAIDEIHDNNDY